MLFEVHFPIFFYNYALFKLLVHSQPLGAPECVFLNTEQLHAGGEQPAHYRGRPKGCSKESLTGKKLKRSWRGRPNESWAGHSE